MMVGDFLKEVFAHKTAGEETFQIDLQRSVCCCCYELEVAVWFSVSLWGSHNPYKCLYTWVTGGEKKPYIQGF